MRPCNAVQTEKETIPDVKVNKKIRYNCSVYYILFPRKSILKIYNKRSCTRLYYGGNISSDTFDNYAYLSCTLYLSQHAFKFIYPIKGIPLNRHCKHNSTLCKIIYELLIYSFLDRDWLFIRYSQMTLFIYQS